MKLAFQLLIAVVVAKLSSDLANALKKESALLKQHNLVYVDSSYDWQDEPRINRILRLQIGQGMSKTEELDPSKNLC